MKKVHVPLNNNNFAWYPPCREIETISYQHTEADDNRWNKEGDWLLISYRLVHTRFKKIVQKKDISFNSLIGNAGGYVGLFLGFALLQLPEMVFAAFIYIKELILQGINQNREKKETVLVEIENVEEKN